MTPEKYKSLQRNLNIKTTTPGMWGAPVLDKMMGIDKMSDDDKIFFNAYKKYGNRNHTWQDFKEMFHGDVKTMQKTVKHWRDWNEINAAYTKLFNAEQHIVDLLIKYNIKSVDEDDIYTYRKTHPDLVQAFDYMMQLDKNAYSNYSVFDVQIAKIEREFEIKSEKIATDDKTSQQNLNIEYINKIYDLIDLRNADFVTGERIDEYRDIILNNDDIYRLAKNFDRLSWIPKLKFAQMILDESAKRHGTPTGKVINDISSSGPHLLLEKETGAYDWIGRSFFIRMDSDSVNTLGSFLRLLAHEDAHRIDYSNAQRGMIGDQIMQWARDNNVSRTNMDDETYKKQATELSSYCLDRPTGLALSYCLIFNHQRN